MHISVAKYGGSENVFTVEIGADLSLKDLKAVIEAEADFGIKAEEMTLIYEGKRTTETGLGRKDRRLFRANPSR